MKAALLKTPFGPFAHWLRDRVAMLKAASFMPEAMGAVGNDVLARLLLERLCGEGKVFVDVGAHIGSVIAGVLHAAKPAKVIAIEAIPAKAERLRKAFPKAIIHCCAVGDQEGEISFFVADKESGYSSIDSSLALRQGGVREIKVPMHKLDMLSAPEGVDLIKIDVEGAELGVLRGAEELVRVARPTIMFESGLTEMEGFSRRDMWRWCDAHDYAVIIPARLAHEDDGLDEAGFVESHVYPPRTTNYFAVARERRAEIRARARKALGFK